MPQKSSCIFLLIFFSIHIGINQQLAKAQTSTPTAPICPAQLKTTIDAVTNRPLFSRVRWGILVQNLGSNQTLYSQDAHKYFIPASNTKLLTTAAALQQLGENYRFRTSIYRGSNNFLYVVGRGDPSLTDAQLRILAKQLKQKGITQIQQLVVDDRYIRGDLVPSSWQWEDIYSDYGAPVSSVILNQNTFSFNLLPQTLGKPALISWTDANEAKQWRVINQSVTVAQNQPNSINVTRELSGNVLRIQGQLAANSQPYLVTLPVVDPNYYFLRRFRSALAAEKITLGRTSVGIYANNQQEVAEVAAVLSPPLSQLLIEINQNSNNLYAEAILRALAIKKPPLPNQATADTALEVLKTTLTQMGVNSTGYALVDGSGLSRKNLISPEALVQTLQAMANSPQASIFRASLPVAGVNGTLKNRFQNTPAAKIVQAKTGTLTGAISLSGYINPPKYGPLVFSIIVNQTDQPASIVRKAIDEIVVSLAQLQRCQ
ncbi:D-alanyl-D-alanine carboxypeptidase/D-alanyl-D-alanine-endopeptidase [Fischerella thermalis CCMEE 5268]|uniref:D-alanyl-D-alanine carboxypeptidase/D-alanyl-D-alanine-endopeptidase n=1 Tax=Fischerella thermalis CCMEE 5268 TaxID=2019662 RepID=A0A2N6KK78_9CYAN|nr:D-alanyl-D-alanine carboxypeptidase/D-alanyl-D-alanine-endopeptidase [Fischerella thermalis]PMB00090.1 D-alanyl-D-alanine carboxypeptidase/D-alanyl-D-alanine-endopeptidase [Fischerella thermalis CCMEE 5268]